MKKNLPGFHLCFHHHRHRQFTTTSENSAQAPLEVNIKVSSSDTINIPSVAREILEKYSLIPPEEVASHVLQIVCRFRFSWFQFAQHLWISHNPVTQSGSCQE